MESEKELKSIIQSVFCHELRIHEEVEGEFLFEGEKRKVVADFVLAPKEFLINEYNFPKGFFIIETKFIKDETIPILADLYIQCQTYKNSTFRGATPFAVFHYTNLKYKFHPETKESRVHESLLFTNLYYPPLED